MDKKNIISFIKFNYQPLDGKYIIKRIIIIWFLSFVICFLISERVPYIFVINLIIDIIITALSLILLKKVNAPQNKFIFDGGMHTYLSLLFLFMSYYFIKGGNLDSFLGFIFLFVIMGINIFLMFFLVKRNIKLNKYENSNGIKNVNASSLLGGVVGLMVARLFLSKLDQSLISILISSLTFFLAVICNIGTLEFLKVYYYKKLKDCV